MVFFFHSDGNSDFGNDKLKINTIYVIMTINASFRILDDKKLMPEGLDVSISLRICKMSSKSVFIGSILASFIFSV